MGNEGLNYLLFFGAILISLLFADTLLPVIKYEYQPLNIKVANSSD